MTTSDKAAKASEEKAAKAAETEPQPQAGTAKGVSEATVEEVSADGYEPKMFVRGDDEREATSRAQEYQLRYDGFTPKDSKKR